MAIEMSNLANGSDITALAASKLTGALPAIDGSALTGLAGGASGTAVYTTPGTYTWDWTAAGKPSTIMVIGLAGGGGGGAFFSQYQSNGGPGGGGGSLYSKLAVTGNITVTVGAGGGAGQAGGNTSVGSKTATGGGAGANGPYDVYVTGTAGAGGTGDYAASGVDAWLKFPANGFGTGGSINSGIGKGGHVFLIW